MKTMRRFSKQFISAAVILSLLFFTGPAQAAYSTSFQSGTIQVITPNSTGISINGILHVEGFSTLQKVWLCVRGPQGELVVYPAEVQDGSFSLDINLRFGNGLYTIWLGESATKFDGKIRFEVINTQSQDNRYLAPSAYVDSTNPAIVSLAKEIVGDEQSDYGKLQAIHSWVTNNISYDYNAYLGGNDMVLAASQTLQDRSGICRNYSFLVAALCRAVGLPTKVVYGEAWATSEWAAQKHAWNEVYVGGRWVTLDATWDAGFIRDAAFVQAPSTRFFDPGSAVFAETHSDATVTLH
ncbi:MAG: transglutaminase domain-containing protein [Ignavibacteriales bacterium]